MSKRIASITLSLLAALVALTVAPTAEAQCIPGSWLCAQVHVGVGVGVSGSVYIGPSMPPPPPQVVYVQPQPQPPVVIYQPQPQPQVVYVQPQQQQVVYVQQQPQVVVGGGLRPLAPMQLPEPRWGVHGEIGAMAMDNVAMGGGSVALRFRPSPWFALDVGIGSYAGSDHNNDDRVEVPFTANGLFFVNPQNRLQLYILGGLGASYAHVDSFGIGSGFDSFFGRDFTYFGGQAGVGLEWRVGRNFALNTDLRGFIRTRTDGGETPEFISATGQTTDTSGGFYWTLGATLYL